MAKSETPKLWCLLGDCTDDVQYYEKAWEVSKHTSARAQRDWAYYYYYKKKYSECIPHFQKSLAINSLQESIWIRLAFSAMEVEDWETAAGAYRRYCSLNSEVYLKIIFSKWHKFTFTIVLFLVFRGLEQCCEMLRQTWSKSSGLEGLTGGR